ncbi:DUF2628 domain-containing protein [Paraburkholderia sp. Ac-20336]|uniref:DUF2628 domain-containing protein n=1 Tax=Paraburkholderia sp. Ac-20336 TaxID=2703886 RepID=UPI00197ED7D5|nr:DUF2628 domain-containing protein [Paraburkholderia sp. Ac-20336]MBN3802177.1 DUF2628 domain-containing protein [Paraburkholderia sp. Ac-20336]
MAFCEQCGTQLGASAAFCSGCGKQVAVPPSTLPITPTNPPGKSESAAPEPAVDNLAGLSDKWLQRFDAIEKAGGERARWWRWPEAKQLTGKEKWLITSNLWAFVFGPFYYLYLGMWRKAITLSLLALVIDVILGMAGDSLNVPVDNFLWIVSAVMFKQCANVDYYRRRVLGRKEWW